MGYKFIWELRDLKNPRWLSRWLSKLYMILCMLRNRLIDSLEIFQGGDGMVWCWVSTTIFILNCTVPHILFIYNFGNVQNGDDIIYFSRKPDDSPPPQKKMIRYPTHRKMYWSLLKRRGIYVNPNTIKTTFKHSWGQAESPNSHCILWSAESNFSFKDECIYSGWPEIYKSNRPWPENTISHSDRWTSKRNL